MTTIRVRIRQEGMHTKMRIFVGESSKTFALAGELAMYPNEADTFLKALQVGDESGPIGSNCPIEVGLDTD